jgi:hypothetical protein
LPPRESGQHLTPLVEQAAQALRRGDREEAARLALDVLERAPGHTGALAVLFCCCCSRAEPTRPNATRATRSASRPPPRRRTT